MYYIIVKKEKEPNVLNISLYFEMRMLKVQGQFFSFYSHIYTLKKKEEEKLESLS